jgi:ribonucleoside-triphosphate reductase
MELAAKAHIQKKDFTRHPRLGKRGPLSVLAWITTARRTSGSKTQVLIGILGVNELAQFMTGKEIHESRESMDLALAVIRYMDLKCRELSGQARINIVLEQTPAESTAYRFAKLDSNRTAKRRRAS